MPYFGRNIRTAVFGQSHAAAIGVTIDGLPAGEAVDAVELEAFMARRAPEQNRMTTQRREADRPEILCGIVDGRTCGAPLTSIIRNGDTRSKGLCGHRRPAPPIARRLAGPRQVRRLAGCEGRRRPFRRA